MSRFHVPFSCPDELSPYPPALLLCLAAPALPPPQFPLLLVRFGHKYRLDPRFKFLVEGYSSDFCWWEAVVLCRKFLLSCVRMLVTSSRVQGQLGVLLLFGCTMAQTL